MLLKVVSVVVQGEVVVKVEVLGRTNSKFSSTGLVVVAVIVLAVKVVFFSKSRTSSSSSSNNSKTSCS